MSRIELSKETAHVLIAPPSNAVAISKLTVHVWLMPDPNPPADSNRQGHVHVQVVRT